MVKRPEREPRTQDERLLRFLPSVAVALLLVVPGAALAAEPADPDEGQPAPAADEEESPPPGSIRAELFTMGTGPLLWEKFGHAALCIIHTRGQRRTICYNYGTTDFGSTASLVWDFLRGRSVFWVSTTGRRHLVTAYRTADRSMWRQPLPLTPEQADKLANLLRTSALEANRYYQYDHFRDNCASRLRDVIDQATGGALSARSGAGTEYPTFRQLARRGFAGRTDLLLASDLLLGRALDVRPSGYEAMFLPDFLRTEVEARLGAKPYLLYERQEAPFPTDPGLGGRWLWVVLALAFAAPVAAARLLQRRERLALAIATFPLGLIGLVIWAVAVITSVPELRWNEALLVFLPSDALLPFLSPIRRTRYAVARVGLLVLISLLLAVGLFRQPLWLLIPMPLLTMLLVALPRRPALGKTAPAELAAAGG